MIVYLKNQLAHYSSYPSFKLDILYKLCNKYMLFFFFYKMKKKCFNLYFLWKPIKGTLECKNYIKKLGPGIGLKKVTNRKSVKN